MLTRAIRCDVNRVMRMAAPSSLALNIWTFPPLHPAPALPGYAIKMAPLTEFSASASSTFFIHKNDRRNFATTAKSKRRRKMKGGGARAAEDEEESDEESEGEEESEEELDPREEGVPVDYKTAEFKLLTKRLDQVSARLLGTSTVSMARQIAQGAVRVNEKIVLKKAYEVQNGDEIEVFIAPYEDNQKLARVQRLYIVYCLFDRKVGYQFNIRWWRNYITDNWLKSTDGEEEEK